MPEKAGDEAPSRRQTRVLRARPSLSTVLDLTRFSERLVATV